MIFTVPEQDLRECLNRASGDFEKLRGARILITGGTGFIGTWLLATLLYAEKCLNLNVRVVAVCRNPGLFRIRCPEIVSHKAVELIAADIRDMTEDMGTFTHVIHAANEVNALSIKKNPLDHLDVIIGGTRRILDLAMRSGAQRTLLLSSGTVYGRQSELEPHLAEDCAGGLDPFNPAATYHEGKRVAELVAAIYSQTLGLNGVVVARIFSLIGPWMPLNAQFAAGNFVRDGIQGKPIMVTGNGTTKRSYLYAADCAAWLWALLVRGRHGTAYQVGSPEALSTKELATMIAAAFDPVLTVVLQGRENGANNTDCYVPVAQRARTELDLQVWTAPREAVHRTIAWSLWHRKQAE